jgi:hypothetical protein
MVEGGTSVVETETSVVVGVAIVVGGEKIVVVGEATVVVGEANVVVGAANVVVGAANVVVGAGWVVVTIGGSSVVGGANSVVVGQPSRQSCGQLAQVSGRSQLSSPQIAPANAACAEKNDSDAVTAKAAATFQIRTLINPILPVWNGCLDAGLAPMHRTLALR